LAAIRDVLSEFRGLEHRMEFVEEIEGVGFYNDYPGSVIKSLEGFQDGVILILGGRDKGSDFTPLREYIKGRVKGLVVIGEARDKILGQLDGVTATLEAEDMTDAVRKIPWQGQGMWCSCRPDVRVLICLRILNTGERCLRSL